MRPRPEQRPERLPDRGTCRVDLGNGLVGLDLEREIELPRLRELDELFERGANGRRVALGVVQAGAPATLTMTLQEMLR